MPAGQPKEMPAGVETKLTRDSLWKKEGLHQAIGQVCFSHCGHTASSYTNPRFHLQSDEEQQNWNHPHFHHPASTPLLAIDCLQVWSLVCQWQRVGGLLWVINLRIHVQWHKCMCVCVSSTYKTTIKELWHAPKIKRCACFWRNCCRGNDCLHLTTL